MMIMQCILALLLCFSKSASAFARSKEAYDACCAVDQRLGLVLLAFFLFSHFRSEKEKERFRARNIAALPPGARNPYEQTMDYGGTGVE